MTCRYYNKCPHKQPDSRACKDIDINSDEFKCGTYRQLMLMMLDSLRDCLINFKWALGVLIKFMELMFHLESFAYDKHSLTLLNIVLKSLSQHRVPSNIV